jgi:hypothetical protein
LEGLRRALRCWTVVCSRCDRAARYRLDTLIARHWPAFGIPGVLRLLAEDCKKRAFVATLAAAPWSESSILPLLSMAYGPAFDATSASHETLELCLHRSFV